MATTLLLDTVAWDLAVDASGNIAVAAEPYATVQDAASAARLNSGELWFDTSKGVHYFDQILGQASVSLLRLQIVTASKSVPGVRSATVYFTALRPDRSIGGQLQLMLDDGSTAIAEM